MFYGHIVGVLFPKFLQRALYYLSYRLRYMLRYTLTLLLLAPLWCNAQANRRTYKELSMPPSFSISFRIGAPTHHFFRCSLALILGLLLGVIPALAQPRAVALAASQACANAAMNTTWNADINLNYTKSATKPELKVSHTQSGSAGITFELNAIGSGAQDRVWMATAINGSGSVETTETSTIPGQAEKKTITRGSGPLQLSVGSVRLDMTNCTYSINLNLALQATTTYPDGSQTQGPQSVMHFNLSHINVDSSASGGPIPTLSGAASPPSHLNPDTVETAREMFWLPASAAEVGSILSEQGHTTAGTANVDWAIRPASNGPIIAEVVFQHQDMPTEEWVPISGQRGTVDGNGVLIFAHIRNIGGMFATLPVRFYDDQTNKLLPDCDETVSFSSDSDEIEKVSCFWDTEGWAWDAPANGNPASQHPNHRIRVELGSASNLLDTAEEPFVVRPKPVIFVHGLNSNDQGWSKYPGFLRMANDHWEGYAVPGLKTGDGIAIQQKSIHIAQNAQKVHQYIEEVRKLENAWHVDIVAHSMGGLISRLYIDRYMPTKTPSMRPVAKHLVMLGTPNQGSECATVQLAIAMRHNLPNVIAPADLMPSSVAVFNQTYTNQRGVAFSVLAGNSRNVFVCNPQPIANDLVVTVPSAHHIYTDVGLTSRNHIQMTDSLDDFKTWVLPRLAVGRNQSALQFRAQANAQPRAAEPAPPLQFAQMASAVVPAGGEAVLPLTLPSTEAASVLFIASPGVTATLRDPSGAVVDTSPSGDTQTLRGFRISAPNGGKWSLHVTSTEGVATSVYATVAVVDGNLKLSGQADATDKSGAATIIATVVRGTAPVAGGQVAARLVREDGSTEELPLADDGQHGDGAAGDGTYGARANAGAALVAVTVQATVGGEERTIVAELSKPTAQLSQVFLPLVRR